MIPAPRIEVRGPGRWEVSAPASAPVPPEVANRLAELRAEVGVPMEFPAGVEAAAQAAAAAPRLPKLDRSDLDLLTIDPPGATDLDQALHIVADGEGFVVSYAIADPGTFITPGDPLDVESHARGQTLYAPDRRTPLYPTVLSEGAASLLPDQVRPALLWTLRLGPHGRLHEAEVRRARVRSRRRLSYEHAQAEIDAGATGTLGLLRRLGELRLERERTRGGVSLEVGEQEVGVENGTWTLRSRAPWPVEAWNAQISLLTGMAAAHLMLYGQVGMLRTLPPPDPGAQRRLHRTAAALHIRWPAELDYPEFVRSLDPRRPDHLAMLTACTRLFRGAGYVAFDGEVPEQAEHAALAIEYTHVTAPLRRLVDRYAGEVCLALCEDRLVPDWVHCALPKLPAEMAAAERRSHRYDRGIVDLVEALVLSHRVGDVINGTVLEADEQHGRGTLLLSDPPVEASIAGSPLPLGRRVAARLVEADVATGTVRFEAVTQIDGNCSAPPLPRA